MKKTGNQNPFATQAGGNIKAPKSTPNQPKADVIRGGDLRTGKTGKSGKCK